MNAITPVSHGVLSIDTLSEEGKIRVAVAYDALSDNTQTAYKKAWKRLTDRGVVIKELKDETLALVISQLDAEGLSPATLSLTVASVKWYFKHLFTLVGQQWPVTDARLNLYQA